jgi:hypothetical protein
MAERNYSWATMTGDFAFAPDTVRFKGTLVKYPPTDEPGPALGIAICNQSFGGGSVSAKITFSSPSSRASCLLILYYDPATRAFVGAGIGNEALYGVAGFENRWIPYVTIGDANRLEGNRSYSVECQVRGSLVDLFVDNVRVATATLPVPLPRSQVGIWCRDSANISVHGFTVVPESPRAFVIMQLTSPYNELYQEVVRPVCEEMNVRTVRADETYGPGLIIADVVRQINESKFVIAEITPANPNVYYEVGYSHACGKPTILIADRKIEKLPFDVSPFRTLFYENSIEGKRRVEEGLRRHIKEVLGLPDATAT